MHFRDVQFLPPLASRFWRFLKASALPWVVVVVLLLLGAWLITWFRERIRNREDRMAISEQMLVHFREMRQKGDLSDEEFRSIKNRLVDEIGKPSRQKSNSNDSESPNEQNSDEETTQAETPAESKLGRKAGD